MTSLSADERETIAHLSAIASALENPPRSVIAWNRAIDREIRDRKRADFTKRNRGKR